MMSSNVCTRCSSFRSANRLRSICSGVSVSDSDSATSFRTALRSKGTPSFAASARRRAAALEHGLAQLVRRVLGRDLELAAIFEELRQPGRGEAARPFGDEVGEVVRDLAAGAAGRPAIRKQELLREREQRGVVGVDVERDRVLFFAWRTRTSLPVSMRCNDERMNEAR